MGDLYIPNILILFFEDWITDRNDLQIIYNKLMYPIM